MKEQPIRNRYLDLEVFYKKEIAAPIIHMHNSNEIYLIIDGEINFFVNDSFQHVEKGDLILIRDNHIHGPKPINKSNVTRGFVHFSPNIAQKLSSESTDLLKLFEAHSGIIKLNEMQFTHIKELITKMVTEKEHSIKSGHDILMNAYLTELLLYSFEYSTGQNRTFESKKNIGLSDIVSQTLDYINKSIKDPELSLEMISEKLAYNKTYLNRMFKKEIGSTIYQYIIIQRVGLAKQLLKENVPPQECAFLCGFKNYSSFYRTFKSQSGLSPSEYVKYYCN